MNRRRVVPQTFALSAGLAFALLLPPTKIWHPTLRISLPVSQGTCPSYFPTYGLAGDACADPIALDRTVWNAQLDNEYPPSGGYPSAYSFTGDQCNAWITPAKAFINLIDTKVQNLTRNDTARAAYRIPGIGAGIEVNMSTTETAITLFHEGIHIDMDPAIPDDDIEALAQWCNNPVGAPPGPPDECPPGLEEEVPAEFGECEGRELLAIEDEDEVTCTWWLYTVWRWDWVQDKWIAVDDWYAWQCS